VGKIQYVVLPNVTKRSRNISNPDGLSLSLKYLLAIKTNPPILILAYPKWSLLPTAVLQMTLPLFAAIHAPSHSLGPSPILHTHPFFPFHINMMTVHVFDY
jgi:hypothetical protein